VNLFDELLISTDGISALVVLLSVLDVVVFGKSLAVLSLLLLVKLLSLATLLFLFNSLSASTFNFGSLLADSFRRLFIAVSALRRRGVLPGLKLLLETWTTSGDVKPSQDNKHVQ